MLGPLLVVLAVLRGVADASAPPSITYVDGRVSAEFQGVPLEEAIAALARETGVEFRGEVRDAREINMRFDRVGFRDVVDRLVGEQNFTIRYDRSGRPRRVDLLGTVSAPAPPPRPALEGFAGLVARRPAVELPPDLAKALGIPRGRLPQVVAAGMQHQDPKVNAATASLFVRQIDADPGLHDALMNTKDGKLTSLLRSWAGPGLPRLIEALAGESSDPLLRSRAQRLKESVAREKPST